MNPAQPSRPDLPQLRRLAALALLLFALPLQAEPATATPPPLIVGDDLRLPEVFTSHLPQTIPSDDFRLSVHPHLGDLKGRDYLRTTIGARYGLTSKWEASASTEFYFTHGLDQGSLFKQVGLSKLGLGTKYNLGPRPIPSWSTAIGFDFSTPVSRPPRRTCRWAAPLQPLPSLLKASRFPS